MVGKNIKCLLGFHDFSKWELIGMNNRFKQKLKRRCKNCGKLDFYEGMVNICIETGEKTPYVHKN